MWCPSYAGCVIAYAPLWGLYSTRMIKCLIKRLLRPYYQWVCSFLSPVSFKCGAPVWMGWTSGVSLGVPLIFVPVAIVVGWDIFALMRLGLRRSEGAFRRSQIHWIRWPCRFRGGVCIYLLWQTGLYALMLQITKPGLYCVLVGFRPGICSWCLFVWGICTIFPSFQTDW